MIVELWSNERKREARQPPLCATSDLQKSRHLQTNRVTEWNLQDLFFSKICQNGRRRRREVPRSISFDETNRMVSVWGRTRKLICFLWFVEVPEFAKKTSPHWATHGHNKRKLKSPHLQKSLPIDQHLTKQNKTKVALGAKEVAPRLF